MKLYRSRHGIVAENADRFYTLNVSSWDDLIAREDLREYLTDSLANRRPRMRLLSKTCYHPLAARRFGRRA